MVGYCLVGCESFVRRLLRAAGGTGAGGRMQRNATICSRQKNAAATSVGKSRPGQWMCGSRVADRRAVLHVSQPQRVAQSSPVSQIFSCGLNSVAPVTIVPLVGLAFAIRCGTAG